MGETLLYAFGIVLNIVVPAIIVGWDLRRLTGEKLARSWPDASLRLAVVAFGPLCVPIHFLRTRRSWAGLLFALLGFGIAFLFTVLPVWGLEKLLGIQD